MGNPTSITGQRIQEAPSGTARKLGQEAPPRSTANPCHQAIGRKPKKPEGPIPQALYAPNPQCPQCPKPIMPQAPDASSPQCPKPTKPQATKAKKPDTPKAMNPKCRKPKTASPQSKKPQGHKPTKPQAGIAGSQGPKALWTCQGEAWYFFVVFGDKPPGPLKPPQTGSQGAGQPQLSLARRQGSSGGKGTGRP
jgi:hypothetical protein